MWNAILTALVSGAATMFAACATTQGHVDYTHCGIMAGIGAGVGVLNLFRQPPSTGGKTN